MNITIKIEAPDLCIAIYDISVAIQTLAAAIAENPETIKQVKIPFKPEYYPANSQDQIKTESGPANENKQENQTSEITYTLEQIRAKLAALSQAGKQAEVKALLSKFGAKKLTEVPPEKYSELMKETEAIL